MKQAILLVAVALPLAAQPKLLVNAQADTRAAGGGLQAVFDSLLATQPQPAWIGYTVAASRARHIGCDSYSQEDGFRMGGGTVHLEPASEALILFRVEGNVAGRVRTLAPDCNIDAGGVPFHWLTGVRPAESVALLRTFAAGTDRISESAISVIAVHAGPEADAALEEFAASTQPEGRRAKAASLLGGRGDRGVAALRKLMAEDTSDKVRERAVQALATSKRPDALDLVIAAARSDRSPRIRGQALFWLAHEAGMKAAGPIQQSIEQDPDREVKRRAVSALRQIPNNEGVPALIELARTSRDGEVRKQAMSTLGQTRDPRAIAFFEQILKR